MTLASGVEYPQAPASPQILNSAVNHLNSFSTRSVDWKDSADGGKAASCLFVGYAEPCCVASRRRHSREIERRCLRRRNKRRTGRFFRRRLFVVRLRHSEAVTPGPDVIKFFLQT
jgi:hypothetical protein